MLVLILIVIAFVIVRTCFVLTKNQKDNRIFIGMALIAISLLSYPLLIPILSGVKGLEGTASLMVFNFSLLIGGIIIFVRGFFK
ncbi:hypothetical protein ACBP89_12700 [Aneurinibacillus aneurinilyticus]|uniref:hypothetical protein n=1 Tax=Aneurinibacillus aneurinilyticus TaxID=1391 RepID=UPI0035252C84